MRKICVRWKEGDGGHYRPCSHRPVLQRSDLPFFCRRCMFSPVCSLFLLFLHFPFSFFSFFFSLSTGLYNWQLCTTAAVAAAASYGFQSSSFTFLCAAVWCTQTVCGRTVCGQWLCVCVRVHQYRPELLMVRSTTDDGDGDEDEQRGRSSTTMAQLQFNVHDDDDVRFGDVNRPLPPLTLSSSLSMTNSNWEKYFAGLKAEPLLTASIEPPSFLHFHPHLRAV